MELIVFDLDGTLLNRQSTISDFSRDTLRKLSQKNIAYTVATGRTLHAARSLLAGLDLVLPQIYKNGVMIWQPQSESYSYQCLLEEQEIREVLTAMLNARLAPFVFTLEEGSHHAVYHSPLQTPGQRALLKELSLNRGLPVLPIAELPAMAGISNISALGPQEAVEQVAEYVASQPHLLAYMGAGHNTPDSYWLDIHHSAVSKGSAIAQLKEELGVSRVLCFGDADNDLSMFAEADEAYAPSNAAPEVKAAATAVIGHHDEDGIAHFLHQRFAL